jgi:predicted O-linked N-acetylglucosamine transferase (SPINDLY family)
MAHSRPAGVDEVVQRGLEHHRSGRLQQAESAYQAALAADPDHDVALHFLGLLAAQSGRLELAADLVGRAVAARPREPAYLVNLGLVLKRQGRLADAAAALRRATRLDPRGADTHLAYGKVLLEQGEAEAARAAFATALELAPRTAGVHNNLGIALQALGRRDEAMGAFRRALELDPTDVDAHINLGLALRIGGRLEESVAALRGALAREPRHPLAANNLGLALQAQGRLDEARGCFESALAASPDAADLHVNLGIVLTQLGALERAHASFARALELEPGSVAALTGVGSLLRLEGKLEEAVACYERALGLAPDDHDVLNGLGLAQLAHRRVHEALACFDRAAAARPDSATAQNNAGSAFRMLGDLERAAERFRAAVALDPDYATAHSNLLGCLSYLPGLTPEEILGEHRRFAERFEAPLARARSPHANVPDPDRRLRVGYVSGDFVEHAMSYSVEPVLAHHDRSRFEVVCYANNAREDEVTGRLKERADGWHRVVGLPDDALAALIRDHGIDVLVDLSGHTALNRLLVFARKPVPVQVAWLGYVTTTGLAAIDYRLTDAVVDPPGASEGHYVETLVRLPCVAVFQPARASPPVNPLPGRDGGGFTFASLNHLAKVTPEVIATWARILRATPDSRLLVGNAGDGLARERLASAFAGHGVSASRLDFRGRLPMTKFLELHHEIDLALDPFPYNGGATSCHSLWMGVPFVTLAGDRYMARMGTSLLGAVGLGELVAQTADEYVAHAIELATDRSRLAAIRGALRERLAASPLMDAPEFARSMERAYRRMWEAWCERGRATSESLSS